MAKVIPVSKLELRRRAEGYSRDQLAAKTGLAPRTIFGIEREGRAPSRVTLRVLADALGCTPADIA